MNASLSHTVLHQQHDDVQRRLLDEVDAVLGNAPLTIGNSFAMLQMRAALATLFQQYRVELAPDYELRPVWRFNTRPADGLPLILRAR